MAPPAGQTSVSAADRSWAGESSTSGHDGASTPRDPRLAPGFAAFTRRTTEQPGVAWHERGRLDRVMLGKLRRTYDADLRARASEASGYRDVVAHGRQAYRR